jgi:hypothetical protein
MEKVSLPTKTKIAAWWMAITFGIIIIFCVYILETTGNAWEGALPLVLFYLIPGGLLIFLLPSFFLFKRKKIGWYWAVITLFVTIIFFAYALFRELYKNEYTGYTWETIILIILTICLPPFILLLLDRKNFWKIAS